MSAAITDETFVVSDRGYDIRVTPSEDLRTAVVAVGSDVP